MRFNLKKKDTEEEMPITPLIDCVFLLIIFFLVTSMFKRFEMLIPIQLPDQTSALSQDVADAAVKLIIDRDGQVMQRLAKSTDLLEKKYVALDDLAIFLKTLETEKSTATPLEISVARQTTTQKVIDVLDIAQIQGFTNVSVKTLPESF